MDPVFSNLLEAGLSKEEILRLHLEVLLETLEEAKSG